MKHFFSTIISSFSVAKGRIWIPLFFGLFFVVLFLTNIEHGTYLSGWDNLQTELYPELSIKRAIFSVWQEYQSLGHVAGLAHASDIVRAVFVWLLSFVLPQAWIRYFFHTLMLVIGGMGMYKLLGFWRFQKEKAFSFIGALFYMLNFGTIQIFSLPFEAFSIFFAALPWELWIGLKYVTHEGKISKKLLLAFIGIQVLATPQAYVQTLFVVYLMILALVLLGVFIQKPQIKTVFRIIQVFFLILLTNLFWLLPQIYFFLTSSAVVIQSKINELSTIDTYFQNLNKGNVVSFVKLQGFYYDLHAENGNLLFEVWHRYFDLPMISLLPYVLFGIVIYGVLSKTKRNMAFLIPLIFTSVLLLNATFPFSLIQSAIQGNSLLFQIFRTPFTKLIIPHTLLLSYFFAIGSYKLYYWLKGHHEHHVSVLRTYIFILSTIVFVSAFPVFQGYLFSPQMKVNIPDEYHSVMQYFRTVDPNSRIDIAPDLTLWGWYRTNWGYDGSGFLWYGIEQPIISRNFDMWSEKSESYHWEMKSAVEAQDQNMFNNVLQKYRVQYLLVDKSLMPLDGALELRPYEQLLEVIKSNGILSPVFHEGSITVYKVQSLNPEPSYVSFASGLPTVGPEIHITSSDNAFKNHGNYITANNDEYDVYYPFLDLSTQASTKKNRWTITEYKEAFVISVDIPLSSSPKSMNAPNEFLIRLWEGDQMSEYSGLIQTSIIDGKLHAVVDKSLISDFTSSASNMQYCSELHEEYNTISNSPNKISAFTSDGATGCFWFTNPYLDQKYGYLTTIESENIKGRPLFFYIHDNTKDQSYLENQLNTSQTYFLIAPKYQYGLGYGFTFHNNSYSNISSENILNSLKVYGFPVDELRSISITTNNSLLAEPQYSIPEKVVKTGYHRYDISSSTDFDSLLFYQEFHSGWKAYASSCRLSDVSCKIKNYVPFLFGTELKDHVLVNNWANGFVLNNTTSDDSTIVIIFWPQYLQFAGFGILGVVVAFLTIKSIYNRKNNDRR